MQPRVRSENPVRALIRNWFNQYTAHGKFWLALGLFALGVDAAISYQFGISMTTLHGLGFALVAVFFALVPDASYTEYEHGRIGPALGLSALCIPLGMVAFYSHLGYGAGVRVGDIQQTSVQNAKFEDKVDNTKKLNEDIEFFKKRRDALDQEMAALVSTKVGAWSVAVRPSSAAELDGAVAAKTMERDQEASRGGCKSQCLNREKELAHLTALRAKAKEIEDNEAQHAAAVVGLTNARQQVAETSYTSSRVVNQTNVAAQLFLAMSGAGADKSIDPDKVTTSFTNIFIAGGGSLAFMIMAPVGFFLAGRYRLKEAMDVDEPVAAPVARAHAPAIAKPRSYASLLDISPELRALRTAAA
jgi:hypothetical protein